MDAMSAQAHSVNLPSKKKTNMPLHFTTRDADGLKLVFEYRQQSSSSNQSPTIIGPGIALLNSLRRGLAPRREKLSRDYPRK